MASFGHIILSIFCTHDLVLATCRLFECLPLWILMVFWRWNRPKGMKYYWYYEQVVLWCGLYFHIEYVVGFWFCKVLFHYSDS